MLVKILLLFTLSLVTSLDSLGVGIAFGLGGRRVRLAAHTVISIVMFAITWGGVALGNRIADFLPDRAAHVVSAILFAGVGIAMLVPVVRERWIGRVSPDDRPDAPATTRREVGLYEAFALGVGLSINNVGGGVSAGLIRLSALSMATLSVFFNILCLTGGHAAGIRLRQTRVNTYAQLIAGVVVVAVGLWELF